MAAQPEIKLLLAVEEASDDEGWATASEVAYQYDGREVATGQWAKKLWAHEEMGLLENRPMPASRFSWGLTEAGMELLYAD